MPIKLVFTCNASKQEEIVVVGNQSCLGEWDLKKGLKLSGFPHAYGECYIERPTKIEFKAVRKKESTVEWELADMNRIVSVKVMPTIYIEFEFNDPSIMIGVHISTEYKTAMAYPAWNVTKDINSKHTIA